MSDQDLAALLAELTSARARARELERELVEIVGSPTWRLAVRLRESKRRVAEAGPVGSLAAGMVRLAQITLNEGPAGLTVRAQQGFRRRFGRPPKGLPRPRPIHRVPPMVGAGGVSIVVPVLDIADPVHECLKWVIGRTEGGTYEVIVVEGSDSEHVRWLLAHFDGLRVIAGKPGGGAAEAWNRGAREATGRFVLFLGAHDLVVPGWLAPLVESLAADLSIGAVGPQLLTQEGPLYQAGRIVWSDGAILAHGAGDDPHRPEHLYRREVDACDLTALLARRDLFERAGGLDVGFARDDYQAVDLAFRLRALGARVVYEPRSRVVRVEPPVGGPAGAEAAAGPPPSAPPRAPIAADRQRLVARHAAALAGQHAPGPGRVFRARDCQPGLRILIVDHMVPAPDRDAGSARMLALLRLMGELGHKVTFAPDNLTPIEPYTGILQQMGVEVLFGDVPILDYAVRHLADLDLIILCRATIAGKYGAALAAQPAHPPIVFDTVDLHFLREERRAALLADPEAIRGAAAAKAAELALARAARMVWVVSPYEAEVLRREDPGLPVTVVPLIYATRTGAPGFARRHDLMFIGGFRHPPNEDAVRHFAGAILPRVRERLRDVRFLAVGQDPPEPVQALHGQGGVMISGHVPDADPVFDACRVFVAPLRYGAGLKGKIIQSLACGLPVVTTSIGAEGIGLTDGETALIADDPDAFADRVVALYRDEALWNRLAEAGRRHVEAAFGPAAVKGRLDAALRATVASGGAPGGIQE